MSALLSGGDEPLANPLCTFAGYAAVGCAAGIECRLSGRCPRERGYCVINALDDIEALRLVLIRTFRPVFG